MSESWPFLQQPKDRDGPRCLLMLRAGCCLCLGDFALRSHCSCHLAGWLLKWTHSQLPSWNWEILCFQSTPNSSNWQSNTLAVRWCEMPLTFQLFSSHHKYSIHLGKGTRVARQPLKHRALHTVMTKMFLQPCKSCGSGLLLKIGMVVPREFVYYRALNPRQCYFTFCFFWGILSNWWAPEPAGSDSSSETCCLPWTLT